MKIIGFPQYSIYEDGRVINDKSLRMLKQRKDKNGYMIVKLYNNGKSKNVKIHRLLGIHFIPQIEGKNLIDHINRNKQDNRLENLRWVNESENCSNRSAYKNSKLNERYISEQTIYWTLTMRSEPQFKKAYRKSDYTLEDVIKIRDYQLTLRDQ